MIAGVVFDLDGTITEPILDFDEIRRALGFPPGLPVLEQMDGLTGPDRREKEKILESFEQDAVRRSTLNPGVRDLLDFLGSRAVRTAVATRNSRRNAEQVLRRHHLRFDQIRGREDGPVKPQPAQVLSVAEGMGLDPSQLLVVGDFAYDTEAGLRAGAYAVYLGHGKRPRIPTRYHFRIDRMDELADVIAEVEEGRLPPRDLAIRREVPDGS
jgi:HAD superfamily hydrolase (TIGR01549 family)